MKQPYVAVLSGIVILLVGIEILLIYTNIDKMSVLTVACTTQANESIVINREMKIRNKTRTTIFSANTTNSITTSTTATIPSEYSPEEITTKTSEETTTERTTTMQSTECRTQQTSRITHPSSSKISSPTTTNDKTTMNTTKTTLITTLPTISTTLMTNQTEDTVIVSGIPNTTSIASSTLIIKITNVTTITACRINITESSSPFTTTITTPIVTLPPMPPTTQTSMSHTPITSTTAKTSSTTVDVNATTEITNTSCRTRITTSKFNYVLRDAEKGTVCVLANMTIHINLKHTTKDSQVSKSTLTVPVNATTTGFCEEKTANMTLSWEEVAKNRMGGIKTNKITFNYAHNNVKFFLDSIFVDMHLNEKEIKENITSNRQLFSAAVKHGIFICETDTAINIDNRINVVISDVYLIVFDECFDDSIKIETICIGQTNIKIGTIMFVITIGITIVIVSIVLIFFVLYLIWYVRRWVNKFGKGDKTG